MEFLPPNAELIQQLEESRIYAESGATRGARVYLAFEAHEGVDLAGAELMEAMLQEANLRGCRLDDARLGDATANGICLQSASLARTNFTKAELVAADFGRASGPSATFLKSRLTDARFDEGSFSGASFFRADCQGTSFRGANLAGADFTRALLMRADFSGADVSGAKFTDASLDPDTRFDGCRGLETAIAESIYFGEQKYEGEAAVTLLRARGTAPVPGTKL